MRFGNVPSFELTFSGLIFLKGIKMRVLRFYWIDRAGTICRAAEEVECSDDADALAKAAAMLETRGEYPSIEIWDRARPVGKVSAPATGNLGGQLCRSDASRWAGARASAG